MKRTTLDAIAEAVVTALGPRLADIERRLCALEVKVAQWPEGLSGPETR